MGVLVAILAVGFIVFGLLHPERALYWANRRSRIFVVIVGVLALSAGTALSATDKDGFGPPIFFLMCEAALVGYLTLPQKGARPPAPFVYETSDGPSPAVSSTANTLDTELDSVIASVPTAQKQEFDKLFDARKRSWSLLGKEAVGARNVQIAKQCAADAARIWALKNGPLPNLVTTMSLPQGEQCVWEERCERYDYRVVRSGASYGGAGVSIRVAKGVTVRTGGGRIKSKSHEEFQRIDAGNLYLTNKRLIFTGERESLTLKFSEVTQFHITGDRVDIARSRGKNVHYRILRNEEGFAILLGRLQQSTSA